MGVYGTTLDAILYCMNDIAEQLAIRDRMRRRYWLSQTPQQRLAEMARLQEQAWKILRSSEAGYAHFIRRNFKARSVGPDGPHIA
jgi:cytochrome c-type biogenesis protein CcmH/NrfG